MYDNGLGVPEDHGEAVKWFRLAANQGHADAQNKLGEMYAKGLGVPRNDAQAHMWLSLAAAQGFGPAAENRDMVAERMTPADVS